MTLYYSRGIYVMRLPLLKETPPELRLILIQYSRTTNENYTEAREANVNGLRTAYMVTCVSIAAEPAFLSGVDTYATIWT